MRNKKPGSDRLLFRERNKGKKVNDEQKRKTENA